MQYMEIEFILAKPAILDPLSYFDGILAWCAVQDAGGDLAAIERLPLKRTSGVYHASTWTPGEDRFPLVIDCVHISRTSLKKELKTGGFTNYVDTDAIVQSYMNEQSGRYKSFLVPLWPLPYRRILFWCAGDIAEVRRLLGRLHFLGAKSSLGYGRIERFEIRVIDTDCSLVRDGRVMRPLPADVKFGDAVDSVASVWPLQGPMRVSPPYWRKDGMTRCHMPALPA